ncbi:hypothetical protein [Bordetella trematum]|uniref:hypothetical protein n=1 Tax=Bordetella trematum TaxID=123899 RepID=UPI003AF3C2A4
MTTRSYTVQFFQAESFTLDEAQKEDHLFQLFATEAERQARDKVSILTATASGYHCELRELTVFPGVVQGCLGLLRPDAPHIREVNGAERVIEVDPGERFLEKNYFLYFKQGRIIAWQYNLAANHITNLGLILGALTGGEHAVSCHVLLDDDFAFDPNAEIHLVDLRVRSPKTRAQQEDVARLNPNQWGVNPFQVMTDTSSKSLALVLTTGRDRGNMGGPVKTMIRELLNSTQTRRLRVKMGDAQEPIDLLARRVKRRVEIEMNGMYPNPASAWQQLQVAKDDANDEIQRCI